MSGVPLPSTTLSPADTRKVQHVAVHAARATCMLKAEALLTSPQAGRHSYVVIVFSFLLAVLCGGLSQVQLFVTSWPVTHQAPLSMEFSR